MTTGASAEAAGAPGSIGVREFDNARFRYRIGTTDEIVLNSHYGSPRYFATEYTPRETDTIMDVGAHIGAFAVLAARQVPKGKVYALEPGLENFQIMKRNLQENEAGNVVAHQLALGATTEKVRLYHGPGSVGHSLYLNPLWADVPVEPRNMEMHSEEGYEEVTCQAFDEYLAEHGIVEIDYMKMNIEGAEYEVLGKAPLKVLQAIRFMHVELHPEEEGLADALIQRLESAGFTTSVVWSDDPTVKGWVTAQRKD